MCLRLALVLALLTAVPWAHAADTDATHLEPALRRALAAAVNDNDSFRNRFDAQVWLMDMSRRLADQIPDAAERIHFLKVLHYEAARAHLKPEWVLALIQVESNFQRYAISAAGARGYMQIMPFWLKEIGHPQDNLFHVETNLRMGCTILRYYLDREHGDLVRALARYNGSTGHTWYPARVFQALNSEWFEQ